MHLRHILASGCTVSLVLQACKIMYVAFCCARESEYNELIMIVQCKYCHGPAPDALVMALIPTSGLSALRVVLSFLHATDFSKHRE